MTETPPRAPARRRGAGPAAVLAAWLTAVLAVGAVAAGWAQRTLLDTDRFVAVAGPVADDPQVTRPLGDAVAGAVVAGLDVDRLPGDVAGIVEEEVRRLVDEALASAPVRERLRGLVREAHAGTVGLARGEGDDTAGVALAEDGVVLETRPAVVDAIRVVTQGLGPLGEVLPELVVPENAGRVLLVPTDAFDGLRDFVQGVDRAAPLLLVGAGLGLVLTLVVATRRRLALAHLGLAVAVVGGLAALGSVPLRDTAVRGVHDAGLRGALRALLEPVGADLTATLGWTAAAGAALAVVAWLVSRVARR
ncbi:hypothetical protein [Isoptericola variabilis]|uniref:Integral membrane protein n=1 Tax=Isoptericola variabilis (strain 225) TaxID=743718 RepID=F6FTE4_ISOV2|nr:hypothetical protein [Isoptericola variabilis]AEG45308.1 integral membrane protein [Isoptericola variabilis 225]TWH34811.1 hypothetical protein L600_001000000390 [Isoptericola variabilis J7]